MRQTDADRQTDQRQTDIYTDRSRLRQTDMYTDRLTDRQRDRQPGISCEKRSSKLGLTHSLTDVGVVVSQLCQRVGRILRFPSEKGPVLMR